MNLSNPIIAINMSKVTNVPESLATMKAVGPKVCVTTAKQPGFLGYEQLLQTGIIPMAGRYGGGTADMSSTLNPVGMFQYTVWEDVKSHEEMHFKQFNTIYELCLHCLGMVVEGPWEPLYEIVASDLPQVIGITDVPYVMSKYFAQQKPVPKVALSSQRTIAVGDHWIMKGHEKAFEQGAIKTCQFLKSNAPGMIGWMLLKQIGVSAIGSFQLEPEGMTNATLGANPPAYGTNYGNKPLDYPPIPAQTPAQYLVHMEWESPDYACQGIGKALVNHELLQLHNKEVLAHVDRGPYYMLFTPMMEESTWRQHLVK
jgi:sulfur oxygenase/reductase